MATQSTETVYVTVNSTEQEITQGMLGNSIVSIARLFERYQNAIKLYENAGYTIISSNPEKASFIAEKKITID